MFNERLMAGLKFLTSGNKYKNSTTSIAYTKPLTFLAFLPFLTSNQRGIYECAGFA